MWGKITPIALGAICYAGAASAQVPPAADLEAIDQAKTVPALKELATDYVADLAEVCFYLDGTKVDMARAVLALDDARNLGKADEQRLRALASDDPLSDVGRAYLAGLDASQSARRRLEAVAIGLGASAQALAAASEKPCGS